MAAARESRPSGSSGEEEGEAALERLREAAWDPVQGSAAYRLEPSGGISKNRSLSPAEPSLRAKANRHERDGNELQTTPEFRAHVAKKLGAVLDSSITLWEHPAGPTQNNAELSEMEDDGFRLFSSSVPGDAGEPESLPSARRRRRKRSSSSSSDEPEREWRRCQEAAVTAAEILKQSGLPRAPRDSSWGDDLRLAPELSRKKKKRKKEKEKQPSGNGVDQAATEIACEDLSGICRTEENVATEDALQRKEEEKKKARKKLEGRLA